MRVLVLGADGMLGHRVCRVLSEGDEVLGVTRAEPPPAWRRLCPRAGLAVGPWQEALERFQPEAVVNCIGVVKQRAADDEEMVEVNGRLPHRLAKTGARLVHFSTDCVFSGSRGGYREEDVPDPVDVYGRSKLEGEVRGPGCLTLRTSLVGWELKSHLGLLDWFAAQRGRTVKGFRRAVFSGLSTEAMAGLVRRVLHEHRDLDGLWHVAAVPIDKNDLLTRVRDALGWSDVQIVPDDAFACDRSLDGSAFEAATGWSPPTWDEMVRGLAEQRPDYER